MSLASQIEETNIDPQSVVSGSIWEACWPMCWTVMVQNLSGDQYTILGIYETAGRMRAMYPFYDDDGRFIRDHENVCEWLSRRGCRLVDKELSLVDKESS